MRTLDTGGVAEWRLRTLDMGAGPFDLVASRVDATRAGIYRYRCGCA